MKNNSYIFIILAAILWGIEGTLLLPNLYSLPVALVVLIQTSILALILTPFFIKKFSLFKKLSTKQWLIISLIALLGGVIGIMAITKAFFYVNYVNLSIVVLIQKLQPLFAIGLASLFLKEKLQPQFLFWSGLALVGTYIMTFGFSLPNIETGGQLIFATSLALIAAISFASTTVLTRRFLQNIQPLDGTYLRITLSAIILTIFVGLNGDYSSLNLISTEQMIYFGIIVVTGGIGLSLYNLGLKNTKASIGTLCELAFPLTAILLEFFIRGNILTSIQFFGVFLLITSVMMIVKK